MAKAPVESSTSLAFHLFARHWSHNSQLDAHVPPTSGHTTDQCLATRFAVGYRSHSQTAVLTALRRSRGLAMSLHSHRIERGGSHWNPHGLRSQPVRSACFRAQKPARDIRCLASSCRSFTFGPLESDYEHY